LPYKLRGAYGDGVNRTIFIGDLFVPHTFSLTVWLYADDLSSDRMIFSKDKNTYSAPAAEDFLDILVTAAGAL
jgi:hypothetical protein